MSEHASGSRSRSAGRQGGGRAGRSFFSIRLPKGPRDTIRWTLVVVAVVIAILLLITGVDLLMSWDRIHPGVTVGGIAVGGMTGTEARALLVKEVEPRLDLPVKVTHGTRHWSITRSRIGATLVPDKAVKAAWAVGRTGGTWQKVAERTRAWFGAEALPLAADADQGQLDSLVRELGKTVYVPPRDAGVAIEGTHASRVSAKSGVGVRGLLLRQEVLTAFVSPQRNVRLQVQTLKPRVADADAVKAYDDAVAMLSGDVTLTFEGKSWKLGPERVARWVAFRPVPFGEATRTVSATGAVPGQAASQAPTASVEPSASPGRYVLHAYMDPAKVSATVLPLVGTLGNPPKDARFKVSGKRVSIVPAVVGTGVDVPDLASNLLTTLTGGGQRVVALRLAQMQPELTTAKAQAMGVRELISSYSTDFSSGQTSRVSNIQTLARALDNRLVPPGGTFSVNGTVGERTAEKGYEEAPAIVNGKLVPQLGGGICQIGTTFFNSVFFSGLPVLERANHSTYISHYPKGRDCTLNWGGPDFRWKNDTKSWVLVKADASDSSVTISLYGTDPGYKVAYTTGPFTNIVRYGTVTVNDPAMPVGARVEVEGGVDGKSVVVVRTVTLKGRLVRKDTFTSTYVSRPATVKVGTKPPSTTPTTTPTPSRPSTSTH